MLRELLAKAPLLISLLLGFMVAFGVWMIWTLFSIRQDMRRMADRLEAHFGSPPDEEAKPAPGLVDQFTQESAKPRKTISADVTEVQPSPTTPEAELKLDEAKLANIDFAAILDDGEKKN